MMKKSILKLLFISFIVLFITFLIVAFIIRGDEFQDVWGGSSNISDSQSIEFELIGESNVFQITVISNGTYEEFVRDGIASTKGSGSIKVDVTYIGDEPIEPGTRIYYDINLGVHAKSEFLDTDEFEIVDPHIVDVEMQGFIRKMREGYSVEVWLGEEKYFIPLVER